MIIARIVGGVVISSIFSLVFAQIWSQVYIYPRDVASRLIWLFQGLFKRACDDPANKHLFEAPDSSSLKHGEYKMAHWLSYGRDLILEHPFACINTVSNLLVF